MVLSPWLSSIASWKKPSSSRFKVSPIVHTAPEKENRRRKRSRSLSLDRLQGPHLNLDTTERNHDTGPHSAAKVDHFFAAADILCYSFDSTKLQNQFDLRFFRNRAATWSNWDGRNDETYAH